MDTRHICFITLTSDFSFQKDNQSLNGSSSLKSALLLFLKLLRFYLHIDFWGNSNQSTLQGQNLIILYFKKLLSLTNNVKDQDRFACQK